MMKFAKQEVSDRDDKSSDSDFDEDDDPDKIEVPGGGKDLATAFTINPQEERQIKKDEFANNIKGIKDEEQTFLKRTGADMMKGKVPTGLIMKAVSPGFEMIRTGSSNNPLQSTANMLSSLGFPPAMSFNSVPHFPPGYIHQQNLDMVSLAGGLNDPAMMYSNMAGINPLMFQGNGALLNRLVASKGLFLPNQQNWNTMNNKAMSQLWMNSEFKMPLPAAPAEEEDNEDEEMGVAETYADYMPPKCK